VNLEGYVILQTTVRFFAGASILTRRKVVKHGFTLTNLRVQEFRGLVNLAHALSTVLVKFSTTLPPLQDSFSARIEGSSLVKGHAD